MRTNSFYTPSTIYSQTMNNLLNCTHLLIGGATGSGKSVLINNLVANIIRKAPIERSMVLIDPKRVELNMYKGLPHTLRYASEPHQILKALEDVVDEMERRYRELQKKGLREIDGQHLYVIIDELADLLTTDKKRVLPLLQRIGQLGRASHIHMILATQRPTRDILSGQLLVNVEYRIALRTECSQDSRNLIRTDGAESLSIGHGLFKAPCKDIEMINIPLLDDNNLRELVEWWSPRNQRKVARDYRRHITFKEIYIGA